MADDEIFDTAISYADGFTKIQRATWLSRAKLIDKLLSLGVEQCPGCRWFVECGELVPDDEPDGHCDNCRPSRLEE